MKMTKVDHLGINTLDIEESVKYYSVMFDFRETGRADMGPLTLVYMENPDGIVLELYDLRGNVTEGERPESLQGFRHVAFYVDNINEWNDRLKEKGAEFTMELTRMPQIRRDGILVKDPNGYIIELTAEYE